MIKKIILILLLMIIAIVLLWQHQHAPIDPCPWLRNRVSVSASDAFDGIKVPPHILIKTVKGFEPIEDHVSYFEKYTLRYTWRFESNITISVSAAGYSTQIVRIARADHYVAWLDNLKVTE
ncbi:MAG TPA: hypothetical protein DCZ95_09535 [Verrucomicrobia bacterium]|nr:hypothetical protein [Verrucomicrobiota bacterium]